MDNRAINADRRERADQRTISVEIDPFYAATRLTNAHAKSEQLAMLLTSFVFIVVVSFFLSLLF